MSNPDSFIAEVSEEVRRDRLFQIFRRYGWIAIAAVLLLVGGAGWREYAKARDANRAEAQGDALLAALDAPDDAARIAALTAIAPDGPVAGVAALLTAAEQEKAGDNAAAARTLTDVVGDTVVDPLYRDLASLKALMLQAPAMDAAALKQGLSALAVPGAPFRLLAQEQIALADLGAGDTDAALTTLLAIAADAEVGSRLKDRAQGLIVALGGEVAASPATPAPVE